MMNIADILRAYAHRYPDEASHLEKGTAFLKAFKDPCSRSNSAGHITGSGIVIKDHQILLIKHRYIQEWFQPGGHIDPGETPLEAAIRELKEETGWKTQLRGDDLPIDIDIHVIPENLKKQEAEHFHVDFAYLLEPLSHEEPSDEEPSAWFDLDQVNATRLARVIRKYRELFRNR